MGHFVPIATTQWPATHFVSETVNIPDIRDKVKDGWNAKQHYVEVNMATSYGTGRLPTYCEILDLRNNFVIGSNDTEYLTLALRDGGGRFYRLEEYGEQKQQTLAEYDAELEYEAKMAALEYADY